MMADKNAAPAADNALSENPILKFEGEAIEFVWIDEEFWKLISLDDDASALIDADNRCLGDELAVPELLLSIVHTEMV